MKKVIRNLTLSLVVLGLLTGAFVLVWSGRNCPHLSRRIWQSTFHREYAVGADIQFRWTMSGSGRGPNGSQFDSSLYRSSDCVRIYSTVYTFSSSADAQAEMQRRLKADFRVLSHADEGNAVDGLVSEKAVTQVERDGDFFIFERRDDKLLMINSPSLNHAMAFEKWMRAQKNEDG